MHGVRDPGINATRCVLQAHGRFADDLPFMGKDLAGAVRDDSGDGGGRTSSDEGRLPTVSQDLCPAAVRFDMWMRLSYSSALLMYTSSKSQPILESKFQESFSIKLLLTKLAFHHCSKIPYQSIDIVYGNDRGFLEHAVEHSVVWPTLFCHDVMSNRLFVILSLRWASDTRLSTALLLGPTRPHKPCSPYLGWL